MPRSLSLKRVPPSPDVMAGLYMNYIRNGKPVGITFAQYLHAIGYNDPSSQIDGMDDGLKRNPHALGVAGPELISVPKTPVTGVLRLIVLLVDFSDNVGTRSPQQFRDILFSTNTFPTGSMRDYYREVSGGKVQIEGTVHGWFRLPESYSFYTNNESGTGQDEFHDSYPHNAPRMAEHAVAAALANGITFDPTLDKFGDGTITALFIVHAGRGAEEQSPSIRKNHIWSHKWELKHPATVSATGAPILLATRYLTVPEDCNMGVCAHELGHLAFQWEDFYDPNGSTDGQWAGSGKWDLMGGGSWNGNRGDSPAHPVGLHKLQHGWVTAQRIQATTTNVIIPPFTSDGGTVVVVRGPGFEPTQSLILENRSFMGFDRKLPGEGLLVWRFDQDREQTGPQRPALQLVQADGLADLEASFGGNQGDDSDPFPGSKLQTSADDILNALRTTSFPGRRSGITLSNILIDPVSRNITLNITIAPTPPGPALAAATRTAAVEPQALGLERLFNQEKVPAKELQKFLSDATPSIVDIERRALLALQTPGCAEAIAEKETAKTPRSKSSKGRRKGAKNDTHFQPASVFGSSRVDDFGGPLWRAYKWANNVTWDREGSFFGRLEIGEHLTIREAGDYLYTPDKDNPFGYETADGVRIIPGKMVTDAGSTPMIAWLVRDLDPFTYLKAYLIHDWEFMIHHCRPQDSRTFEEVNHILAEGIYTLMMTENDIDPDWRKVALVHTGVSSPVGSGVWNKIWSVPECVIAMP